VSLTIIVLAGIYFAMFVALIRQAQIIRYLRNDIRMLENGWVRENGMWAKVADTPSSDTYKGIERGKSI